MKFIFKEIKIFALQLFLILFLPAVLYAQDLNEVFAIGEKNFASGKYLEAEKYFSEVLEKDPDNYKVLRAQADTKIKLKKFKEAEELLNRILAMPESRGRNILVFEKGSAEGRKAELVDETVMVLDESSEVDEDISQFVKDDAIGPVPHFRVYILSSGKMELLLKSKYKIKYHGIPTATRELVSALKSSVQKMAISMNQEKPEEEMVLIEEGCFQMGSDSGNSDERPVHKVCLSSFKIGKYEVRQKYFQNVMGYNLSQFPGADLPVESVAWEHARDYCKKQGYRLPTEAEWEYAARGGTKTEYYWGNEITGEVANFCDSECDLNSRDASITDGFRHTSPVGSFPPNPFGLFDMAGNVSEWVFDWMPVDENYYLMSPEKDPRGPRPELDACSGVKCVGSFSITQKINRGGSWNKKVSEMRSANRMNSHFQLQPDGTGFRCAVSIK
ncbi:MAG: SUMF1/EgtB/PvdO family nonheme iron enzyme [Nitrospina sp.]|nr:SUMF1/EgtB/PvdO family nonheme iron enzyme [Nitrospina sp.]MBT6718904.1 SUMF1/EgtB/PvdO family nonheme iron enzyme [Nitrospina sp.]